MRDNYKNNTKEQKPKYQILESVKRFHEKRLLQEKSRQKQASANLSSLIKFDNNNDLMIRLEKAAERVR